jgi:hypothetical protein
MGRWVRAESAVRSDFGAFVEQTMRGPREGCPSVEGLRDVLQVGLIPALLVADLVSLYEVRLGHNALGPASAGLAATL